MSNLERGATAGGYTILTTRDFPIVLPKLGNSMISSLADVGKYTKIATVEIPNQYNQTYAVIKVTGGENGAATYQHADIFFRVKQQAAMGSAPVVNVVVSNPIGMTSTDVAAVVVKNDSSLTRVELYVKIKFSFDVLRYRVIHEIFGEYLKIVNGLQYLSTLPSGTQVSGVLEDGSFNNLTMGGKTVITTDHTSASDPHTQYVRKMPYKTSNTGATASQWALIGTVTMTAQYQMASGLISFLSGVSGVTNAQRGLVYFRVKQQAAMGSAPVIETFLMNNNSSFLTTDIMTIVTSNTSSQTVIQLYARINGVYEELYFNPLHELTNPVSGTIVNIVWANLAPLVATTGALPAGTQQTAQYQQTITTSATANRPTSGTYAGMPHFDTTLNKPIWRNATNNGWVDSTGTTV